MILNATTAGTPATSLVASRFGCAITRVSGYYAGTTDSWLHIIDAAVLPTDAVNKVPRFAQKLYAAAPFDWRFATPLELVYGCTVGVSKDQNDFELETVGTPAADINVEGTAQFVLAGTSVAGQLNTAVAKLDIFTTAKTLYEAKVIVATADATKARYVQLFQEQYSGLEGTTVPVVEYKVPISATPEFTFSWGRDGKYLTKCCIALSDASGVFTENTDTHLKICGIYI